VTCNDTGRHTCAVADWLYQHGLTVVFVDRAQGDWWLATPEFISEAVWGRMRQAVQPLASRCHVGYRTARRVTDCPWCGVALPEKDLRDLA
jgi:hypothetical protein